MSDTKNTEFHNISDYFEKDHDRLDFLFREYMSFKHVHFSQARESFAAFKHGIEKHIAWEDEVLFPAFQKKTGIIEGPIKPLREDHQQILSILEEINLKLQRNDASSNRLEHDLIVLLGHHSIKEENVIYPVLDHLLSYEEKKDLFKKIQSIAANRRNLYSAAS